MHVARQEDVETSGFIQVVRDFERNLLPSGQDENWNFLPSAWRRGED